jgi:dTDP-4-amino-4,6-dideoxygalactose transaminase
MSYWKKRGLEVKDFPESEKKFNSTLSLPLWPGMTKKMANFVIDRVKEIGEKAYVR